MRRRRWCWSGSRGRANRAACMRPLRVRGGHLRRRHRPAHVNGGKSYHRNTCMKWIVAILGIATVLWGYEETVAPLGTYTAAERRHWAFQPRKVTAGTVDSFIAAGLRKAGLKPAPAA